MFSLFLIAVLSMQAAWVMSHNQCEEGGHTCPTHDGHNCIPSYFVCDGYTDCSDQSDETNCSSANCTTPERNGFWCENAGRCINENWKCDGINDCFDWSDENQETCPTCSEDQFSCNRVEGSVQTTPFCITKYWVCDGIIDCQGQEDEANCPTTKPSNRRR